MAFHGGQISVTGTRQTLSALLGYSASNASPFTQPRKVYGFDIRVPDGTTASVYVGESGVTAVPANAEVALTASLLAYSTPFTGGLRYHTDEVYLIATTTTTCYVQLWD